VKRLNLVLLAVAACAAWPVSAHAHVQVNPTAAAPGDAVRFEFLVPNERDESTVEVALQVPRGVLPFSYNDPPGWRRTLEQRSDESVEVVRWRGRLRSDGFTEFGFIASTPEQEGTITWKAIQTYEDGEESAWIGPPDAEEPAATTEVRSDVARQNAGGEGEGGGSGTAAPTASAGSTGGSGGEENDNTLPIILGAGGLVLGAAALVVALRRRRA
jgi:LPXTG-motif cell wall-anchored protein